MQLQDTLNDDIKRKKPNSVNTIDRSSFSSKTNVKIAGMHVHDFTVQLGFLSIAILLNTNFSVLYLDLYYIYISISIYTGIPESDIMVQFSRCVICKAAILFSKSSF